MDEPEELRKNDIKNKEKIFELTSNKGNQYIITFINKITSLIVSSIHDNGNIKIFYENTYTLEKIKENKIFAFSENIDEFLSELFPLIDQKKASISEENNHLVLSIKLPFQKIKNIYFIMEEKKKTDSEKINDLFNIINGQNIEMNKLKEELKIIKEEIQLLKESNKSILNKLNIKVKSGSKKLSKEIPKENKDNNINNYNKNIFDSTIIKNLSEIQFIINRLKHSESFKNKEIFFKLLYRATEDKDIKIFHEKCDNKPHQLVFIQTEENLVFGGYTQVGFKSIGKDVIDNNAFVFSNSLKKIYNVKKDKPAIYCDSSYGPSFRSKPNFMIFIYKQIFHIKGLTCSINDSYYEGMTRDFEINNGQNYFIIKELEVFQIL